MKNRVWLTESTIEAGLLLALFGFICMFDAAFAVTLSWKFCAGATFICFVLSLPGLWLWKVKTWMGALGTFTVALFVLHFTSLSPIKPYTRFYNSVKIGMSKTEVDELFDREFPRGGTFRRPVSSFNATTSLSLSPYNGRIPLVAAPNQSLDCILDPSDGSYNAEFLVVYFKNGTVVGSDYSPD